MNKIKTPWHVEYPREDDDRYSPLEIKEGKETVCSFWQDDAPCEDFNDAQAERAERIVRAVNAYDTLVEGLDRIARLGNEPFVGNSDGNQMAVDLLREINIEPPFRSGDTFKLFPNKV